MRGLGTSGSGRFLLQFLPVLGLLAVFAAIDGEWPLVVAAAGVTAILVLAPVALFAAFAAGLAIRGPERR